MIEIFYDIEGNIYKFNIDKKIGSGNDGKIYRINKDICIKIFRYVRYGNNLESILKVINNLDLDNLYKIKKILYNNTGDLIGYTMKYYKQEDLDILTMPIEYTIENMIGLYKVADTLGNNKIRMHDLIPANTIQNKDGIIIIDADNYMKENSICSNFNKNSINYLLDSIYKRCLNIKHEKSFYTPGTTNKIKKLFLYNNPDKVYRELQGYKYPIDYIIDRK